MLQSNRRNSKRQMAIERLAPDDREYFEERAAIREFDGNQPRGVAEMNAMIETKAHAALCAGAGR